MRNFLNNVFKKFQLFKVKDDELEEFFHHFKISSQKKHLYKLALTHGSFSEDIHDNERLEFIGDAVFGMIITEVLYHKYPDKDEGKLTAYRSKVVGRQSLNSLGKTIGLEKFIYHKLGKNSTIADSNYVGNAFEALIGAMYLDKGYEFTQQYIKEHIMNVHVDFEILFNTVNDYKSALIIWAQKHKKKFHFDVVTAFTENEEAMFKVAFILQDKKIATGIGKSKKKAEQEASKYSLEKLNIIL